MQAVCSLYDVTASVGEFASDRNATWAAIAGRVDACREPIIDGSHKSI